MVTVAMMTKGKMMAMEMADEGEAVGAGGGSGCWGGLTQARRGLLGQQVAGQHLLPCPVVVLGLELEHGLRLVLC